MPTETIALLIVLAVCAILCASLILAAYVLAWLARLECAERQQARLDRAIRARRYKSIVEIHRAAQARRRLPRLGL